MGKASATSLGRHPDGRRRRRRPGAGRKPKGARAGRPHDRRPEFSSRTPVHVTVRVAKGIPNLRSRRAMAVLSRCFRIARERLGMRVTQYSIQANHIHLIVEAEGRYALSRAMKGLSVRIARRLNRAFDRKGKVIDDRFHAHILWTPREVRNAVRYVMNNSRIHAGRRGEAWNHAIDRFAGGPCRQSFLEACRALVVEPRSFILRLAWELPRLPPSRAPPPRVSPSLRAPPPRVSPASRAGRSLR